MALRYDRGELGKVTRTPQGGLRVDAYLTRTGVLAYRNPDGSRRGELRTDADVFSPESLATLADAPVVAAQDHTGKVTAANYQRVARGHVSGAPRQDGARVAATLVIQDAELIRRIEAGEAREISCGYDADLVPETGSHADGAYEYRQSNIRYNHVAVVPRGRAGSDIALRLDAQGDMVGVMLIDGKEYDEAAVKALITSVAAATQAVAVATARADAAEGRLAAIPAAPTAQQTQERLDAAVEERIALLDMARKIVSPEYVGKGRTNRQVREDMIAAICGVTQASLATRSDAYLEGVLDQYVARSHSDAVGAAGAVTAGWVPPSTGGTGIITATPTQSWQPPAQPQLQPWQQPLTGTRR